MVQIMHQFLNLPHSVFYYYKGIFSGVMAVVILANTLHTYFKTPLRQIMWLLVPTTVFLGLYCLEAFSESTDPLYHPSTRTAHLGSAALTIGCLGIVMALLAWRGITRESKAIAKPPAI